MPLCLGLVYIKSQKKLGNKTIPWVWVCLLNLAGISDVDISPSLITRMACFSLWDCLTGTCLWLDWFCLLNFIRHKNFNRLKLALLYCSASLHNGVSIHTCCQGDISILKVIVRWESLIIKFFERMRWNRQCLIIYYLLYLIFILPWPHTLCFFQCKEKLKNQMKSEPGGGGVKKIRSHWSKSGL